MKFILLIMVIIRIREENDTEFTFCFICFSLTNEHAVKSPFLHLCFQSIMIAAVNPLSHPLKQ